MADAPDVFRVTLTFSAPSVKDAKVRASAAAKAANGKLERLTVQRMTWGPIAEDENSDE